MMVTEAQDDTMILEATVAMEAWGGHGIQDGGHGIRNLRVHCAPFNNSFAENINFFLKML